MESKKNIIAYCKENTIFRHKNQNPIHWDANLERLKGELDYWVGYKNMLTQKIQIIMGEISQLTNKNAKKIISESKNGSKEEIQVRDKHIKFSKISSNLPIEQKWIQNKFLTKKYCSLNIENEKYPSNLENSHELSNLSSEDTQDSSQINWIKSQLKTIKKEISELDRIIDKLSYSICVKENKAQPTDSIHSFKISRDLNNVKGNTFMRESLVDGETSSL
jgi:archaellum component FlaC